MLYRNREQRMKAISEIRGIMTKINEVPGDHLDYITASKAINYLKDLITAIDREDLAEQKEQKIEAKRSRLIDIYAAAVDMVEGPNPMVSTLDMFEIMRDANEYTVSEICYVVDKLYADGFIRK